MKRVRSTFILVFVFWSLVMLIQINANAANCFCQFNQGRKQLITDTKYWWGSKYVFECDYNCTSSDGRKEVVRGTRSVKFIGDEEGNEYVCEGTIYAQKYSSASNWFYYDYVGSKPFSPAKSKSPELNAWATENCSTP